MRMRVVALQRNVRLLTVSFFALIIAVLPARAKEVSLTAIELYTDSNGPAYVQISNVLINGKVEMRDCGNGPKIDKSSYGRALRVNLSVGSSLEYGADGTLTLTKNANPMCVVPSNVKFEKNAPSTAADVAKQAMLQATVIPAGTGTAPSLPPLKPGVKLVFIAMPDTELAEYLRAERSSAIPLLQDYLARYPSSPHTDNAKQLLTGLLVKSAQGSLDAYRASLSGGSPSYQDLKAAQGSVTKALTTIGDDASATSVNSDVTAELQKIVDEGEKDLKDYRQALSGHTAGYTHLLAAQKLSTACVDINQKFPAAIALQNETNEAAGPFQMQLNSGESLATAKRFDEAFAAISNYRSFAGEVPRIAAILDAAYQFHLDRGQQMASALNWEEAIKEFQQAANVKQTKEIVSALDGAKQSLQAANDKNAAMAAIQKSEELGDQHQYIEAYELLVNLPPTQRTFAQDDMQKLAPAYVDAASQTAKDIQQAHDPVHGLADELEMERAYGYLERAYSLNNDPNVKERADNIADDLSDYYLQQARHYLDKPLGSGAGLGWSYLNKALEYKASNLDQVRDQMTSATAAYQMRSKLSIRVTFRDQTSRRDSAGFADQLADSIATGLETSGLPVRIIRPGESPALEPNFQLVGDVLQHGHTMVPTSEAKDSEYRAGEQEMPNEEWNKANREYEAATLELQTDQVALQGAIGRGKKKDVDDANAKVADAQKKVEDMHTKLDSIPKTVPSDIVKPYTYTEKHIDLSAVVDLQFRITDSSDTQVQGTLPVSRNAHQVFTVLENVKPEDTQGIKVEGTIPDEIQFLTDVENSARDGLIKSVKESVAQLPDKIFAQAVKRASDGDMDGAAELYILYLNSTAAGDTPNRQAAMQFLQQQYNIKRITGS